MICDYNCKDQITKVGLGYEYKNYLQGFKICKYMKSFRLKMYKTVDNLMFLFSRKNELNTWVISIFFFNFALLFVVYDLTSWVRKCHIAVSFFVYISLWRNNYLPKGCSMNRYFPKGLSGKFKTYTIKAQTNAFSMNVNISNKLWFLERCSLITATVCAKKIS